MGTTTRLGLCVLAVAVAVFLLNGWSDNVGEWASDLADWIMDRDEQRAARFPELDED